MPPERHTDGWSDNRPSWTEAAPAWALGMLVVGVLVGLLAP